ncbi:hypothetical protein [Bacillus kexueae]|uniref:hypothetical protein n=1 Tax=Aeribacillus kexueae TaxID=2078952 RepID=UPI001FAF4859|nr:hypothetical protein [Bacillus kexueae]
MKKITFLTFILALFILGGCNSTEVIKGTVNETLTYEDMTLTVNKTEVYDTLVETSEGYNTEVTFGDSTKAVLVNIEMNTGEHTISNSNFELIAGEGEEGTSYEALPTDLQYHEKYNVIDFNDTTSGDIQGNLIFPVNEEDITNESFTLAANFDGVTFSIPMTIKLEEPKVYTLGETVTIDNAFEITFKDYRVVTDQLTYNGSEVVLGSHKLVVLDAEVTPLGDEVIIKDENLFFVDSNGELHIVDTDEYDGFNELVNVSLQEKTEGQIKVLLPEGINEQDLTFFIETSFSKTEFTLNK